jgi:hypothetical protein
MVHFRQHGAMASTSHEGSTIGSYRSRAQKILVRFWVLLLMLFGFRQHGTMINGISSDVGIQSQERRDAISLLCLTCTTTSPRPPPRILYTHLKLFQDFSTSPQVKLWTLPGIPPRLPSRGDTSCQWQYSSRAPDISFGATFGRHLGVCAPWEDLPGPDAGGLEEGWEEE